MNLLEEKKIVTSSIQSKDLNAEKHVKRNIKSEIEIVDDDIDPQKSEIYESDKEQKGQTLKILKKYKKSNVKSKQGKRSSISVSESTKLEENASQVLERFKSGCECQDDQCFKGLNPETVYRHRLNIAELTKAEHDMYLMGVIRSCLANPYETVKHTERQRLRAQYVYQGRKVCLDAFLYLENCTLYQIKRIRKHLMIHGVTPRVHGNYGKVPHNTFSLDIYQIATQFVKNFIKEQELKLKAKSSTSSPLYLPSDITRKTVHDLYKEYCKKSSPNIKSIGYSTFRTFLKVQFPQLRFAKLEFAIRAQNTQGSTGQNCMKSKSEITEPTNTLLHSTEILNKDGNLVPVIFANEPINEAATFIWAPYNSALQEAVSYQVTKSKVLFSKSGEPLTITNLTAL